MLPSKARCYKRDFCLDKCVIWDDRLIHKNDGGILQKSTAKVVN